MTDKPTVRPIDEIAIQALSDAGAICGDCGSEPGDRVCPDCERCRGWYVAALRAAGWAPGNEELTVEVSRLRAELAQERENYQAYRIGAEGAKAIAAKRITDLEGPAVEARAALAALCYDLEDPGSNALGALYLISQATVGVDAPKDDAARVLAQHDAQVMRRCAEFVRDTYQGEWADDAAATLERDADITERGCPGFEKEYQGVSDAKRRLANCRHCGKPRAAHPAP